MIENTKSRKSSRLDRQKVGVFFDFRSFLKRLTLSQLLYLNKSFWTSLFERNKTATAIVTRSLLSHNDSPFVEAHKASNSFGNCFSSPKGLYFSYIFRHNLWSSIKFFWLIRLCWNKYFLTSKKRIQNKFWEIYIFRLLLQVWSMFQINFLRKLFLNPSSAYMFPRINGNISLTLKSFILRLRDNQFVFVSTSKVLCWQTSMPNKYVE